MGDRQVQKLFKKYAAVSTTDGSSFDSISDYNTQMDMTEFTRFAKDFGLTEVLTIAKLKMIFNEANVADGADDRRGLLSQQEFSGAVQTCLERAKAEFARKEKEVNNGVRMLERELKGVSSRKQHAAALGLDSRQVHGRLSTPVIRSVRHTSPTIHAGNRFVRNR